MNGQLALLAPTPAARRTDPETSHMAAATVAPTAATSRARALQLLREHPGGLTDFELADLTGLQPTSVGVRRGELRKLGLVENTGKRRRTPSGSTAIVWRAT